MKIWKRLSMGKEISDSKKRGFSLAETLITIGLIGMIATMTYQVLSVTVRDKTTTASLKKTYSTLQQALLSAVAENGPVDSWGISMEPGFGGEKVLLHNIAKHLNTVKICEEGKGCYPNRTYKNIDGSPYVNWNILSDRSAAILADGTMIMFNTSSAGNVSEFGQIYVDINGAKPPNQVGVDFFYFYIFNNTLIPSGAPARYGTEYFIKHCIQNAGFACAAWVVYNGNLDYLYCNDLTWEGKHQCKYTEKLLKYLFGL